MLKSQTSRKIYSFNMENNKIFGVILLVIGIALSVYGFNIQNSFGSQIASAFGQKDNSATIYIVLGVVASILGIILLANKGNELKK